MTWQILWRDDGCGTATHGPSGVVFNVTKSGWMAVKDDAGQTDSELRRLMSDLVVHMGSSSGPANLPDARLLH
jgi:hypothetical protein